MWGRRQWRKNPDSEKRERRYRLRDRSERVEVEVPDLRIVDDSTWEAVRGELERRQRKPQASSPASRPRAKHLLSGLIRCSCCGANYTISGKDYYRCAGEKERGTCGNKVSVRKEPLETATLAVLQDRLLTEEHTRIFVEQFEGEMLRLSRCNDRRDAAAEARLSRVEVEIANLAQNFLSGMVSPALMALLTERESEKARLEAALGTGRRTATLPDLPPATVLRERFTAKIEALRSSLDEDAVRPAVLLPPKYLTGPRGFG